MLAAALIMAATAYGQSFTVRATILCILRRLAGETAGS